MSIYIHTNTKVYGIIIIKIRNNNIYNNKKTYLSGKRYESMYLHRLKLHRFLKSN